MKLTIRNFQKQFENEFEDYIAFYSNRKGSEKEILMTQLHIDLKKIEEVLFEKINKSIDEKSWNDTTQLTGLYYEKVIRLIIPLSEMKSFYNQLKDEEEDLFQLIVESSFRFFSSLLDDIELEFERYLDAKAKANSRKNRERIFFHRFLEYHLCEKENVSFFGRNLRHPIEPILTHAFESYEKELEEYFLIWKEQKQKKGEVADKITFLDEELQSCKNHILDFEDEEEDFISLSPDGKDEVIILKSFYMAYIHPFFEKKRDFIIEEMDKLDEGSFSKNVASDFFPLNFHISKNELIALFVLLKDGGLLELKNDSQLSRFLENHTRYGGGKRVKAVKPQISSFRSGGINFQTPAKKILEKLKLGLRKKEKVS